jgi:5-methylcytosine-specific restriction endonuclease McrA
VSPLLAEVDRLLESGLTHAEISHLIRRDRAKGAALDLGGDRAKDHVGWLLGRGFKRAEIARILALSKPTVSYHAARVGAHTDARYAHRYDWAEIRRYYERGHSRRDCQARFGFSRQAWANAVGRGAIVPRPHVLPIEELLAAPRNRSHLKMRLAGAGLLGTCCERCGIAEWCGEPLALELHHKNGDGQDNQLENLSLLCPNCHSQTDTWSGRNKVRPADAYRA